MSETSKPNKDAQGSKDQKGFLGGLVNQVSSTVGDVLNKKADLPEGEPQPDPADLSDDVQAFVGWLRQKNKGLVIVELIPFKDETTDQALPVVQLKESGFLSQNYLFAFGPVASQNLTTALLKRSTSDKDVKYSGIALLAQSWPLQRFSLEKELGVLIQTDRVQLGKDGAATDYLNDWLTETTKTRKFDKKDLINPKKTEANPKQAAKSSLFIGREEVLTTLGNKILSTSTNDAQADPAWIFSIAGEGGIGKSYLLKEIQALFGPRMVYASVNHEDVDKEQAIEGDEDELIRLMNVLTRRLRENDCPTPHFEELYKKYLTAQNRLTKVTDNTAKTLQNVRKAFGGTDAKTFSKAASKNFKKLSFLKFVPGVINITGTLVEVGFGVYDRYNQEQQAKDDVILNDEVIQSLTDALIRDLAKFADQERKKYYLWRRPVLVFDTYEKIGLLSNQWLRTKLISNQAFQAIEPVVIVAGRYDLTHLDTRWTELQPEVQVLHLTPFTQEDAVQYLQKLHVTDPQRVEDIIKLAGGSPLFLNLIATTKNEAEAVRRLKGRILEEVEADWRNLFVDMAVPDGFNVETIQHLLHLNGNGKDSDPDTARDIYKYLEETSFVEGRGGRLHYLSGVRWVLLRSGELESPAKVAQVRTALQDKE